MSNKYEVDLLPLSARKHKKALEGKSNGCDWIFKLNWGVDLHTGSYMEVINWKSRYNMDTLELIQDQLCSI